MTDWLKNPASWLLLGGAAYLLHQRDQARRRCILNTVSGRGPDESPATAQARGERECGRPLLDGGLG